MVEYQGLRVVGTWTPRPAVRQEMSMEQRAGPWMRSAENCAECDGAGTQGTGFLKGRGCVLSIFLNS